MHSAGGISSVAGGVAVGTRVSSAAGTVVHSAGAGSISRFTSSIVCS